MTDAKDCRFCCGKPVKAEVTVGEGIKTMSMMLDMMIGGSSDKHSGHLKDGIQLESGNILCFDSSSREYVPLGIRICYCPFCGRELKPEEEE